MVGTTACMLQYQQHVGISEATALAVSHRQFSTADCCAAVRSR